MNTAAILLVSFADLLQEGGGGFLYAAHALYAFDDDCSNLSPLDWKQASRAARHEREEDDVVRLVDRSYDGRIVRHSDCQGGTSVEYFVNATIFLRPLWKDASFSAILLASAPELQRKS